MKPSVGQLHLVGDVAVAALMVERTAKAGHHALKRSTTQSLLATTRAAVATAREAQRRWLGKNKSKTT